MTSEEFVKFREAMALKLGRDEDILSERKTAALLGVSRNKVHRWSATHEPPLPIAYACQALIQDLAPWGEERNIA